MPLPRALMFCSFLLLVPTVSALGIALIASRAQENGRQLCVESLVIPPYPPLARQARVRGEVTAVLRLNKNGGISEVSNVEGPSLLIHYVRAAVTEWRFVAPLAEPTEVKVTFRFSLEGNETDQYTGTNVRATLPGLVEITTSPPAPIAPNVEYKKPKRKTK